MKKTKILHSGKGFTEPRFGRHFFLVSVLAVLTFFGTSILAQNTVTGAFQGRVTNNLTDQAVPGAAVTITNEKTGGTYSLITDSRGEFYQGLLAPGSYLITIELNAFKPQRLRMPLNISKTGEVVPVPVTLEPLPAGTLATAPITVDAHNIRVEINTTDARRDGSFDDKAISTTPVGSTSVTRSLDELALLLPGVAPPPQTIGDIAGPGVGPGVGSAGQFSVNGLRSRANNFTVDGSDNNDEDIGVRRQGFVALSSQPVESIQEVQIITLLAPAQFGRNIGAQVNIVSKTGGSTVNGSLYGFLNSDRLNARNYFDTTNGDNSFALQSSTGQAVLLDGQPLIVQNHSGGKDPFTAFQGGGTIGGPIIEKKLYYFLSGEYQNINATQEKSFAVPTVDQRGAFETGATGLYEDPFTRAPIRAISETFTGGAIFSLYPFPNNLEGIYGRNTFTQQLKAGGRGTILSGRSDYNFNVGDRAQTFTARYNFTDDRRDIPAVDEAIFASVLSKVRTHNISLFLNSQIGRPQADTQISNQVRFSIGRTGLRFDEVRDTGYLIPSDSFPNTPFLLNAQAHFNFTQPAVAGSRNLGPVILHRQQIPNSNRILSTEDTLGPLGQVKVAGFSSLGADVYNFPQDRTNTTYQIADELTFRFGRNTPVVGFDLRRTELNSDLPRLSRPLVTFNGAPRLVSTTSGFRFPNGNDPNPLVHPVDLVGLGAASDFLLTFNVDRPDSKVDLRFDQINLYAQNNWRINSKTSLSFGLRYEFNTPVKEANRLIEGTFNDPRLSVVPGLRNFIGARTSLYEPDYNNFAPRLGIAFSPDWFGKKRTSVFRAGYGLFYDQVLGAVANQSRNVFPTYLTLNYGGLGGGTNQLMIFNPANNIFVPGPQGVDITLNEPGTINTFNPQLNLTNFIVQDRQLFPNAINATLPARHLDMPSAHHYSVVYEQQLSSKFVLSVGYVGTYGRNLLRYETPNLGSSKTAAPTSLQLTADDSGQIFEPIYRGQTLDPSRPMTDIGAISVFSTTASSRFDSLQTQLRGRFVNGLDLQVAYVFAKGDDDVSDVFDLAGASALPQNSFDLKAERGPANFDVRHRLAYDITYDFGHGHGAGKSLGWLVNDLQIASIGRFHTGQPFTVNSLVDVNLDGNLTDRLDNLNGLVATSSGRQPVRLETANPFTLLAPFGQNGTIGRNSFRAGKLFEIDLSATKSFEFGLRRLSFRADIFNLANRANFGIPVRILEAPGFGLATRTLTPARRLQLSVKYSF